MYGHTQAHACAGIGCAHLCPHESSKRKTFELEDLKYETEANNIFQKTLIRLHSCSSKVSFDSILLSMYDATVMAPSGLSQDSTRHSESLMFAMYNSVLPTCSAGMLCILFSMITLAQTRVTCLMCALHVCTSYTTGF